MVHVSVRKVQATNMFFSSWVLVFLAVGIITEEWAELKLEPKKPRISHSPWICCTPVWPEGILLLCALLLYQQMISQGESVYYSSYKITWIIFTAYLSVFFLIVSGCRVRRPRPLHFRPDFLAGNADADTSAREAVRKSAAHDTQFKMAAVGRAQRRCARHTA
ncbi:transmembrane protein 225 [Megaptera novaeangliae]